jgi:thiamine-phosphate pyrophosphorylase
LHVITDSQDVALAALAAGAPAIQLRVKDRPDAEVYRLACEVRDAAAGTGALVLVDDRVDVAVAAGVAGAHVGEHDLPVDAARRVLGPDAVLGATARDPATARRHEAAGATYLGVGPTYATRSKDGLPAPLGPARVGEVARSVDIPVIAIAGITVERVPELLDAGVHGVAVISAIAQAPDVGAATEAFLGALDREGAASWT